MARPGAMVVVDGEITVRYGVLSVIAVVSMQNRLVQAVNGKHEETFM